MASVVSGSTRVITSLTGHLNPTDLLTVADGQALFATQTALNTKRDVITPEQYGAKGDGTTDDTTAMVAAASAATASGAGAVVLQKRYRVASFTMPDGLSLVGPHQLPGERLPGNGAAYQNLNGTLIIEAGATITTGDSTAVSGLIVVRDGLALPFPDATTATAGVAAFAGTAFTVGGADTYFAHLLILGFNQPILSNAHERVRCEYIQGDCTNGISITDCTDISRLHGCHFFPFTTVHQTWTTDTLLTRSGTAYAFESIGDWCSALECFSYGYLGGFDIGSCDHMNLVGCGNDYPNALASTSIAYNWHGTSRNGLMHGCQAAAQGTAVLVNTTAATGAVVTINGCDFWSNDTYHVHVQQGRALILGSQFSSGPVGVQIDSGSGGALVLGNTFDSVTTPVSATGTGYEKSVIGPNTYFNCSDSIGSRRLYDNQLASNYETSYSTNSNGYTLHSRISRGSASSPVISNDLDVPWRIFGDVHDGTAFQTVAGIRMQANGAPAAGATPGEIILSTTPAGSTTITDRWIIDKTGAFYPGADNSYSLGVPTARMASIYTYGSNIAEVAAASVATPGAGTQTLFIDTADHKLKRKDSSGTVTIIA